MLKEREREGERREKAGSEHAEREAVCYDSEAAINDIYTRSWGASK